MKITHEFELGGETVTGRCTFRAINAFEQESGVSIPEAWDMLSRSKLPFSILARAVWAFINGERVFNGKQPESYNVIGEKMHQEHFVKFTGVAGQFFLMSVPSSDKPSVEDAPEKKSSE